MKTIDRSSSFPLGVLIVDDEANIRKTLRVCLESRGCQVTGVGNAVDALAESGRHVYDLAFVDLRLGTESGLDLITALLGECPWIKIVVITAYASVETAVEAIKRGAIDYIPKPFTPEQIEIVISRVAMVRNMEQRITSLKEDLEKLHPEVSFTSHHPGMQRAVELGGGCLAARSQWNRKDSTGSCHPRLEPPGG
jgi:NtrC-family two-component system response regulator AlgB